MSLASLIYFLEAPTTLKHVIYVKVLPSVLMVYGYVLIGYGKTCRHGNYHLEEVFIILTVPWKHAMWDHMEKHKGQMIRQSEGICGAKPFLCFP